MNSKDTILKPNVKLLHANVKPISHEQLIFEDFFTHFN